MPLQMLELETPELALQRIVHQILNSGKITNAERICLHQAIASDMTLDHRLMQQVQQVLIRLQMGLIKVVD